MSESIGTCCGIDQAIEYLKDCQPRHKGDDMPERIMNRLRHVRNKDFGVRPKFHKGQYSHKYDYWTCGNCGTTGITVNHNYCWNCGYRVLWESTRCLTDVYRDGAEA